MVHLFFITTLDDAKSTVSELAELLNNPSAELDVVFVVDSPILYPQLLTHEVSTIVGITKAFEGLKEVIRVCDEASQPGMEGQDNVRD
jgi:hypothetical protein